MKRKKGDKPEDIGAILKQVIKKLDTKTHGAREELTSAWKKSIAQEAVFHTRPVAIKKKTLTIEVDSSTWLYMLSLKKKSTLDSMKKILGSDRIKDIKFRMGEIT
ncbi:MAG: DUF721 domain-containing protein [Candidatus Omnitrophota bacterium]